MRGAGARREDGGIPVADIAAMPSVVGLATKLGGIFGRIAERSGANGVSLDQGRKAVGVRNIVDRVAATRAGGQSRDQMSVACGVE